MPNLKNLSLDGNTLRGLRRDIVNVSVGVSVCVCGGGGRHVYMCVGGCTCSVGLHVWGGMCACLNLCALYMEHWWKILLAHFETLFSEKNVVT